ncbi:MAG: alkaline phosphatase family protein, partial [Chloroflexota bacterium]|nr:alkaline phosphatase family protein [Chloroflexota bacterium]
VSQLDVDAFSLYFVDPAAFIRTIVLSVGEVIKELIEARRQRVNDIQPRVHRGLTFAFLRAATNVVLRDLNTTFVVRSMSLGVPTVYVDLTDYDEIAHHAGPERLESLRALTGVDRVVASLERAARDAPRDYRFVILSDHGQSQGATFLQRHGQTLESLVADLMGADTSVTAATGRDETFGPVNALLTDLSQRPGMTGKAARAAFRSSTVDGTVELGGEVERAPAADTDLVVCASGNLANVYFTASQERLRAADIDRAYPGLLASLAEHPGIGFVMVRSAKGTVVLGSGGVRYLEDDRVEGEDPLALFGERAAEHLRRLDGFPHVGDLLINSTYDPELGEVAAFEELVGSHGGMGGPQTQPFLLHPTELAVDDDPLVGAPAVHGQLRRWTEALGIGVAVPITTETEREEMPEPRGLRWVAAWLMLTGAFLFLGAFVVLVADLTGLFGEVSEDLGDAPLIVAAVLTGIGLVGLATGVGIWRRLRWAWMTALVIQGFNVLQLIMAVASGGYSGLVTVGIIPAVLALLIFYYLTRPHVAAVFGRK